MVPNDRPSKFQFHDTEVITTDVKAALEGKLSLRHAAEEYGIATSTLHDKVSGKVDIDAKSGGF